MSKRERLSQTILRRPSDASVRFSALGALMQHLGFEERICASHHLYGGKVLQRRSICSAATESAKAYQVRQVRRLILKHELGADD